MPQYACNTRDDRQAQTEATFGLTVTVGEATKLLEDRVTVRVGDSRTGVDNLD